MSQKQSPEELRLFSWKTVALLVLAAILGFAAGITVYNHISEMTFDSGVQVGITQACTATCEDVGASFDRRDPLYKEAQLESVCLCKF